MNKTLGFLLLAVGAGLIVCGFNASDSVVSGLAYIFHGAPSNKILLLLLAGSAATAVGWNLIRFGRC